MILHGVFDVSGRDLDMAVAREVFGWEIVDKAYPCKVYSNGGYAVYMHKTDNEATPDREPVRWDDDAECFDLIPWFSHGGMTYYLELEKQLRDLGWCEDTPAANYAECLLEIIIPRDDHWRITLDRVGMDDIARAIMATPEQKCRAALLVARRRKLHGTGLQL